MATWIFQCNPNHYDIDGLLASDTDQILFAANQQASRMTPGDVVFLWRSQGKDKAIAGIVGKGVLIDRPRKLSDTGNSEKFWVDKSNALREQLRVRIRINETVSQKKEVVRRSWMVDDPILKDLKILKMSALTNYRIAEEHEQRLNALWNNTGVDWSRADTVAALRAYQRTYGGSLSVMPGSPISDTAILIGRSVKGVYNKVLNIRHLDPRDPRAGFSGSGEMARKVWDEFYDPKNAEIDLARLEHEFENCFGATADIEPDARDESETGYSYRPGPLPGTTGYMAVPKDYTVWYVYILALKGHKVLKIGHSADPKSRLKAYNRTILTEITSMEWRLSFHHHVPNADTALEIEQEVLKKYSNFQLASNGEILKDVSEVEAQLSIISAAEKALKNSQSTSLIGGK